jgi:glycosyltransferase involved in cell wall biosynthesis
MSTPLVSVITPTFNQARFLRRCVGSVLAQTYEHWEQIVLDDASTDDTASVAAEWRDPRIRYALQPHAGILALAQTYNSALGMTRGELVAILEGDDFWAPEKLASLVACFRDPDVVLAYGKTAVVIGERVIGRSIPDDGFARAFGSAALFNRPVGAAVPAMLEMGFPFTFPCSILVRRADLDAIGGFRSAPGLGAVDYPTFLTLALRGRFAYVDRVVAYWRRHPGSGSWPGHQRDMHAAAAFSRGFIAEHAARLTLSPAQRAAIESAWRRRLQRSAFNTGRYLLIQRRWTDAKEQFRRAIRSAYAPAVVGGVIGYAASVVHRDIERLMSVANRVSFATVPSDERPR